MSYGNNVVWSEGLFIKPQHFQQQQRNIDSLLQSYRTAISQYLYGLQTIELNQEYPSFGRIGINSASGIFPDGTSFSIPSNDAAPEPLQIETNQVAGQIVYLAIPLKNNGLLEVDRECDQQGRRYQLVCKEVIDIHSETAEPSVLELGQLQIKIMLEEEQRQGYCCLPFARILERRADGSLLLDQDFIPCHLSISAAPKIRQWIAELSVMVRERAKNIAMRMSGGPQQATSQSAVADLSDFMLLQLLNRISPQLAHLANLESAHPERVYSELIIMCGELFTYTDAEHLAPDFPAYQHMQPATAFIPLIKWLRQSLSIVLQPKAMSLQLQKRRYGLLVAPIHDSTLLQQADFILAVKSQMQPQQLGQKFLQQSKAASIEKIRELISLQLPGIPLQLLPTPPRQLPYHAGYIYFQLDQQSTSWQMLDGSSGFAFHVAGDFPELDLQLWAIRRN
ncbi:type VI secretion system baseplate subunit TssK [Pelagibaculum spongiae]|uniref:Type VI secretion system baseplate subunit TssK n=1 Tax=Pelagibaculum spongiae TaxID=2080658 RepID=A0A2V1H0F3_9GAMM|nr:type VI secretion system baseplate subunit TssK [Pelagibaculum spongiae]PVZ68779.1 type VI secretion system baseplate subunit TssK [Pelagibaculum spongiae]